MARLRSHIVPLLLGLLALGADASEPDLHLRASPRRSVVLPGQGRRIVLTAEIVGPETEEYYCPKVIWVWENGTRSSEESDCEPYERRTRYPRRFTRRIVSPRTGGPYRVCVELRKADKAVDRSCTDFTVR